MLFGRGSTVCSVTGNPKVNLIKYEELQKIKESTKQEEVEAILSNYCLHLSKEIPFDLSAIKNCETSSEIRNFITDYFRKLLKRELKGEYEENETYCKSVKEKANLKSSNQEKTVDDAVKSYIKENEDILFKYLRLRSSLKQDKRFSEKKLEEALNLVDNLEGDFFEKFTSIKKQTDEILRIVSE
jgi:hypothetical protein